MRLHIENPEAHRLARAIADETGETLTKVVIDALRERLGKKPRKATAAELMAIARRVSKDLKRPYVDHGELLYDEDGLPR